MLVTAALLLPALAQGPSIPTFWIDTSGRISVEGESVEPKSSDGVAKIHTPFGVGFNFTSEKNGLLFADLPPLRLINSITIAAWIFPRRFAPNGVQSEIFFRGDDRGGYDPYFLEIMHDGTVHFCVTDEQNHGAEVKAPIAVGRWTHVTGNLNAATGELSLYIDGTKIDSKRTLLRPFQELIPKYVPGIGVGNLQNNKGPYNQPFDGILADLRVYARAVPPTQAGFHPVSISTGPQP